jgi:hypothetical protein
MLTMGKLARWRLAGDALASDRTAAEIGHQSRAWRKLLISSASGRLGGVGTAARHCLSFWRHGGDNRRT